MRSAAMLIASTRQTARDLEQWRLDEEIDALNVQRMPLRRLAKQAIEDTRLFAVNCCYVGVSWGKDSVVVAHLAVLLARSGGPSLPIVWVRREPIDNPDCQRVRDRFAEMFPRADLHEVRIDCERDLARPERWWPVGRAGRGDDDRPKQVGFARAAERFGARYISGVRAAESAQRERRMASSGVSTANTCAPIGWWSTAEVFAYLHANDLPIHPAYAQTGGGLWPRERIRVGSIGGPHGRGHGRAEWERRYYPEHPGAQ